MEGAWILMGRLKYSRETIDEALRVAKENSINAASKKLKIPHETIRHWVRGYVDISNHKPSKSEILQDLVSIMLVSGPDVKHNAYLNQAKWGESYSSYWASWLEFRAEAAKMMPFAPRRNTRTHLEIKDGLMLVASDLHYIPHYSRSTIHRFMLEFCKEYKPTHIVLNGDILDVAELSTHRPIGWKENPRPVDEIAEANYRLNEIREAAPGAERYINWGNHETRFSDRLAEHNANYRDLHGMELEHHIPGWRWQNCIRINEHELEIKHRFKSGPYATRQVVMLAGISYCFGHDHQAETYVVNNLRGMMYGIDTGTASDLWNPCFEYNENNPSNWQSACGILRFRDHTLLPPELARVVGPGEVDFRGRVYSV